MNISCFRSMRPNLRLLPVLNGSRHRESIIITRLYASQSSDGTQRNKRSSDFNEPVKFSTSNAKSWDPINTFIPERVRGRPKSEPLFVIGSLFAFCMYFMFLREPNEIDEKLSMPLEDLVPNIREITLKNQIKQYESMGLDTGELKRALEKEIKAKQAAVNSAKK